MFQKEICSIIIFFFFANKKEANPITRFLIDKLDHAATCDPLELWVDDFSGGHDGEEEA